jgi:endonuclease YncB( thermonuclease family)
MKKLIVLTLVLLAGLSLTACKDSKDDPTNWAVLPDLNGLVESEIIEALEPLDINYEINYYEEQNSTYSLQFIMYENYNIGDIVDVNELVKVLVYPEYVSEYIFTLPDFSGLTEAQVLNQMLNSTINYYFTTEITYDTELVGYFAGFDGGFVANDEFNTRSALGLVIYKLYAAPEYFEIIDMVYDGPYLDASYASINYLDPRGGYFEVTLSSCTDGDTGRFNYPTDVYNAIQSSAKSARFLNMDTEETYSGSEEEWGKPGSVYTCSLLTSAEKIIIQTDPGGLLGTYGRLLSWVWVQLPGEDEFFLLNYMVVKQGLAQVKFDEYNGHTLLYGDYTYNEWMHIAENYAIDNELGQWGEKLDYYWNYDTNEPYFERWYNN